MTLESYKYNDYYIQIPFLQVGYNINKGHVKYCARLQFNAPK